MKPKNNAAVRRAYVRFSCYLTACIALAVVSFSCFLKTNSVEVKRIVAKTQEYDQVYMKEIELANSVDSIYQYMKLMNTSPQINDVLLQSVVSGRKMGALHYTQELDAEDCLLYRKLLNDMNLFLGVKDSIRFSKLQEEMVREDLMRCIQDNRKTKRKLNVGGLTMDK